VSGRHGFVDLLLSIIHKKETKAPSYQDAFATVRYKLGTNHTLGLNTLYAGDRYKFSINGTTGFNDSIPTQELANNTYGNSYVWMTLRSALGRHLLVKTLASYGSVTASRRGDEHHRLAAVEYYGVVGHRDFTVGGIKQDYSYELSDRFLVDWGADFRSMHANFDWTNRVTQDPDNPTPDTTGYYPRITRRTKRTSGTTFGAYVSNRIQVVDPLALELGVRYDGATYTGDHDWSPRLHALLRLGSQSTLRGGWGQYRQRQGIGDENAFDKLNRYFPSELSEQWTLGFEHRYARGGSFRAEAYHKRGSHLRPILRNWKGGLNVFPESAEDRILVYTGATTSKGFELYHEGRLSRRVDVRAGYALSLAEERVTRIDNVNERFPLAFDSTHAWPQDQRHALTMDLNYHLADNWSVVGALTFHSGWPYTYEIGVPVKRRNGTTDIAIYPESLYAKRLPYYQRMDLRVTRRKQTPNGEFRFFFEVINATNHANVLGYDVFTSRDASGAVRLERDTENWFTILPSLGVSWSRRF